MIDLTKRLRGFIKDDYAVERPQMKKLCNEAADRIEQLEREVSRLRQELGQPLVAERDRDEAIELLKEAQNALLDYVERLEKQGGMMNYGRSVLARIDALLGAK